MCQVTGERSPYTIAFSPARADEATEFAQEFVWLYDRVSGTDPDLVEEFGRSAETARAYLSAGAA